jgi:hypothetical protein
VILKCIIILYNYSKKTMLYVLLWVFNLFMRYNWAFLCVSYSRSFFGLIFKGMMINTERGIFQMKLGGMEADPF